MLTPIAIKTVFKTIESIAKLSINNMDHGMATNTTKIPERLSVAIVANINIKASNEIMI
jgi:hypothetical protein